MNGYEFAQGLLWTLPAVAAGSFVLVVLILRAVLAPTRMLRLVRASGLIALVPTVAMAGTCVVAWVWGNGSANELEPKLIWALPPFMGSAFFVAFLVLHSMLGPDQASRHVIAAVLIAQFGFTTSLLAATMHPFMPDYQREAVLLGVAPELLFIPWLISLLRWPPSEQTGGSELHAWIVVGMGLVTLIWAFVAADFWASKGS